MILFLALAGAFLVYFGAIGSVKRALSMEDHEVNLTIGAFSGLSRPLIGPWIYRDGWSAHHSEILRVFALRDFFCVFISFHNIGFSIFPSPFCFEISSRAIFLGFEIPTNF